MARSINKYSLGPEKGSVVIEILIHENKIYLNVQYQILFDI